MSENAQMGLVYDAEICLHYKPASSSSLEYKHFMVTFTQLTQDDLLICIFY